MPELVTKVPHDDGHYIYPKQAAAATAAPVMTMWVVADTDTVLGLQLLTAVLQSVGGSDNLRAAVFFSVGVTPAPSKLSVVLKQLLQCAAGAGDLRSKLYEATESLLLQAMQDVTKVPDLTGVAPDVATACLGTATAAEAEKAVVKDAAFCPQVCTGGISILALPRRLVMNCGCCVPTSRSQTDRALPFLCTSISPTSLSSQVFGAESGKSGLLVHGDWKIPKKTGAALAGLDAECVWRSQLHLDKNIR